VTRNWIIGCYIAEYELNGADRAVYGNKVLDELSKNLKDISNCNKRQLYRYIQFYRTYPELMGTLSPEFKERLLKKTTRRKPEGLSLLFSPQNHALIELKVDKFNHENIGQLNSYVTWYKKNIMAPGDNPPVGILLCTEKNHALVEYALDGMDNNLFVSKYMLELPKKEEIQSFIEQKIKEIGFSLSQEMPEAGIND
jgi:hypothetical protein